MEGMLAAVIAGGVVGWTAGLITSESSQSTMINLIVGIIGAVIGSWSFGQFGVTIGPEMVSLFVTPAIGAMLLLLFIALFKNR